MLIVLLITAALAVGLDQLSKALIYGHDADFIKGFIRFASVENRGVAWGFLNNIKGATAVITVFTLLVIALMVFVVIKYRKSLPYIVGIPLAMVMGGAVGNLIDRLFLGYVRDFIAAEFISFPVFNVADAFVTCGGIFLAAVILFSKKGREFTSVLFPDDKKKNE